MTLNNKQQILLTDTVGFIQKLPHNLIESFKATLEETLYANYIIHLIDISNTNFSAHIETTYKVLEELNITNKQIIMVFNKIDLIDNNLLNEFKVNYSQGIFISIKEKKVDLLIKKINEIISNELEEVFVKIPSDRYDLVALLEGQADIKKKKFKNNHYCIHCFVHISIKKKLRDFFISKDLLFA